MKKEIKKIQRFTVGVVICDLCGKECTVGNDGRRFGMAKMEKDFESYGDIDIHKSCISTLVKLHFKKK